jgi:hypothetical protein
MDRLEHQLSRTLRRKLPSPGLAGKVMARVRAERRPKGSKVWRWALAGALAASLAVGVYVRQAAVERARAESARNQLLLSLEIASSKVNQARQAVLHANREDSL